MITKEAARLQIESLITRFAEQLDSYLSGNYNETLTRRDYTDQKINAMVYQLYDLSPGEIAMVENFR